MIYITISGSFRHYPSHAQPLLGCSLPSTSGPGIPYHLSPSPFGQLNYEDKFLGLHLMFLFSVSVEATSEASFCISVLQLVNHAHADILQRIAL